MDATPPPPPALKVSTGDLLELNDMMNWESS
jgi:hypothetical protein